MEQDFEQNLRSFYNSARQQHTVSFWASMIAAGIGLLVIVLSIMVFLNNSNNLAESVLLAISGVLSEFIGAAFFYIHNKNISQINSYYSKLIKRQDTQTAIDLVQKMDAKNHDYMYMNIINVLLLRNEPNKELTPELVKALREKNNA